MDDKAKKTDRYRDTVFLPKTDFPMKAGLPEREPQLLKRWAEMGLFKLLREQSKGREKFVLHDGPPYANGNIHIGHALNKILKDMVSRSAQMAGLDSHYVPGWDCHGLPIEWKIEEQYRAKGKNKDAVPINEFRKECRDFAQHWIDVQREEFKRLGVEGNWDNPYTTMNFRSEAVIARELMKFAETGQLYRGSKPVMWSVVEKTALAEAEIEYADKHSPSIYVRFPLEVGQPAVEALFWKYRLAPATSPIAWRCAPMKKYACGSMRKPASRADESAACSELPRSRYSTAARKKSASALAPRLSRSWRSAASCERPSAFFPARTSATAP